MEFEAKLILDVRQIIVPYDPTQRDSYGRFALGNNIDYNTWIEDITNGGKAVPTDFEPMRLKYFEYLDLFLPNNPYYSYMSKDNSLAPKVLIDLLKDSKCL